MDNYVINLDEISEWINGPNTNIHLLHSDTQKLQK